MLCSRVDTGDAVHYIVQSSTCCYWWILPPISFVVQPVVGNVAGDTR